MSNSSRIEAATRQNVNAVLTGQMINDLVKVSFPDWKGGIYPSDCAYKREGTTLVPRGKTAYGDGVLEYLAENSFRVLPTEQIVRRPTSKKAAAPKPAVAETEESLAQNVGQPVEMKKTGKKPATPASKPPSAGKIATRSGRAVTQ